MVRFLDRKLSILFGYLFILLMVPCLWVSKYVTGEMTVLEGTTNIYFISNCMVTYILGFVGLFLSSFFMNRASRKSTIFSFIKTYGLRLVAYVLRIYLIFKGMSVSNNLYLMKGTVNLQTVLLFSAILLPVITLFFRTSGKKSNDGVIDAT